MNETVTFEPRPLGGWLILVGLGVVINPFKLLFQTYILYAPIITDGIFPLLLDKDSGSYQPTLFALLVGEILVNSFLILGWAFALYAFFTRKTFFPKLYIILALSGIAFVVIDASASAIILDLSWTGPLGAFGPETIKALVQATVAACIWVPYMLISVRVKETFVFLQNGKIAGSESLRDVFD